MGTSKIKVCFLIPSLSSGGIETYLLRFLNHQKENISATVLVRNSKVGELLDSYKATGAEIIIKPLGYFSPSGMHFYYKLFKEFLGKR